MNQFAMHVKPKGWRVCPICGCDNIRAGVSHRALIAEDTWLWKAMWVKSVSVCFGTDTAIEPIKAKA